MKRISFRIAARSIAFIVGIVATTVVNRTFPPTNANPQSPRNQVSEAQKKEFIELLETLPSNGEFFTDDAVKTAGPYLPTLLALTEQDIKEYNIYPFLALSRGFCDNKEYREYATAHFAEIRHPMLKLGWAVMLFDEEPPPPRIVKFLRDALKSTEQANTLGRIIGPGWFGFLRRLDAAPED